MTRYFFLHLHKTAGTALWRRLQRQFEPAALYPGPQDDTAPDRTLVPEYLIERYRARRDEIQVVTGHFPLCTTEVLGDTFSTFTVLRHPVDRTISVLQHHRDLTPGAHEQSLEEIYDDPIRQLLIRNHMIKMVALRRDEMTDGALTDITFDRARLDLAKERLASIDVVGVQPRFEEFCTALAARFGWNLGGPVEANKSTPVPVSEALRERIAHDNALDIEFYDHATTIAI
ncbi:MAG: hypothetical protein RIB98_10935 [Acidimicrobiales bacterium]